jgi:hypothetical protein
MGYAIKRPDTAFSLDKSSKATKRIEDPAHLAFIRKLPSVVSGLYGCEAAHIRAGSALHRKKHTGGQQKPDDFWVLSLTPDEHKAQHSANELAWWRSHGIDPFELALKLYEVSGNVEAATTIIRNTRRSA